MKKTLIIGVIALIALIGLEIKNHPKQPEPIIGSVSQSHEYHATTTIEGFQDLAVIQTGQGALGSVVITVSGTAPMTFYDATTSSVLLRTGQKATSTITMASFLASPTVGTYTFDTYFADGLLVDFGTGSISTTTITHR